VHRDHLMPGVAEQAHQGHPNRPRRASNQHPHLLPLSHLAGHLTPGRTPSARPNPPPDPGGMARQSLVEFVSTGERLGPDHI
jgi:hypothetical protein